VISFLQFFAEIFAYPAAPVGVTTAMLARPLGFIEPDATLHLLAEIGILLLLFEVGLETDVGRMIKVGVQSLLVAATGVVLLLASPSEGDEPASASFETRLGLGQVSATLRF
jgi:Kef-type K+ transport system membrane component KefB